MGGALAAVAGVFAAFATFDLIYYGHLFGGGFEALAPVALLSGLLAGPTYWWLAGKPQPPDTGAEP